MVCPTWAAWAEWTCNSAHAELSPRERGSSNTEPRIKGKGPQGPFSFVPLALEPARRLGPERLRRAAVEKAEVADALQAGVARGDHARLRRELRQGDPADVVRAAGQPGARLARAQPGDRRGAVVLHPIFDRGVEAAHPGRPRAAEPAVVEGQHRNAVSREPRGKAPIGPSR